MNNFKSLFVFLLLSLSSLAALAMPSVADVETTIASGDYAKAKTQLTEVLKANPNSYVANRYMLEIIRIENARDNQSSVGYKIYEDKLKQIEKVKAARLEAQRKAIEDKATAERAAAFKRAVWSFFKFIFWAVIFGAIAFALYLFYQRKQRQIQEQREREARDEWKGDIRPELIDLNRIFKHALANQSDYRLGDWTLSLLRDLDADNIDTLGALDRDDYNPDLVERHVRNAKEFIDKNGLTT